MQDSELRLAHTRISSACVALTDVEKLLHSAADAAPGQQVAGRITQALKAIGTVREELQAVGSEQLPPPVEKVMEEESLARHVSEVNSDEYDMQG